MAIYPPDIVKACQSGAVAAGAEDSNASGRSASFVCGCFAAFALTINSAKEIAACSFRSNGCGYMIAAASLLSDKVAGRGLGALQGLNSDELLNQVESELGVFPTARRQCCDVVILALRNAFADFRLRQIEEFRGEKAPICTCFGVTEDAIEQCIDSGLPSTVDEVTLACRAGGGCGSCRMLIQEMLDDRDRSRHVESHR